MAIKIGSDPYTPIGRSIQLEAVNPGTTHTHIEADITNLDKYTKSEVDTLIANVAGTYTHPNHTGEVTSLADGAQTVQSAAITNRNSIASFDGGESMLIYDPGVGLVKASTVQLVNYLNDPLVLTALAGGGYTHPNHTGEVRSVGDGAQTVHVSAISNRSYTAAGNGGQEFLINDAGTLWKISMTQLENYLNSNLSFNDYTHPNHTGEVVSVADGAQTLQESAITNRNYIPSVDGSEDMLMYESGTGLVKASMAQLVNYLNDPLVLDAIGGGSYTHPNHTGEVTSVGDGAQTLHVSAITNRSSIPSVNGGETYLANRAGVLYEVAMSQIVSYLEANLSFNNYSHPNHTGEVTSSGDGAQTVQYTAVSNRSSHPGLAGGESFLTQDSTTLYKVSAAQLLTYMQDNLSFPSDYRKVLASGNAILSGSAATTPQTILSSATVTNAFYESTGRVFKWEVTGNWGGSGITLDFHLLMGATEFSLLSVPSTYAGAFHAIITFSAVSATTSNATIHFESNAGNYMTQTTSVSHGSSNTLACKMDLSAGTGSFSVYQSILESIG